MHDNNTSKFIKYEPHHEHKQKPLDIAWHKPYLKVLYNTCMLLLMDNLMDNSNMAMLNMEPRKQIITLHNNFTVSFFIQSAVGILLDAKNAAAGKPNVTYMCYYHPKIIEPFWEHATYILTTYNKH